MPQLHAIRETSARERLSAWTRGFAVLAATVWLGQWTAIHIEPAHGSFYLLIVSAFLASALRLQRPGRA